MGAELMLQYHCKPQVAPEEATPTLRQTANQVKKNQVNKIRKEGNFLLIDPETKLAPTLRVNPAAVT